MKRYSKQTTPRHDRTGFTLIELIVVVVIIAALIGLLIPAVGSVRQTVRVTEVRAEISGLESAIADFKLKFGQTPPSRITIYETQMGWDGDSRSRSIIRGLWPKFNFSKMRDIDNGGAATSYTLEGDQCLVFFLGGQWSSLSGFLGFSANPTDPFIAATGSSATRVCPFFDFDNSRVKDAAGDIAGATYSAALSSFPVYVDGIPSQTKPYLYSSSYEGTAYRDDPADNTQNDANTAASDPAGADLFRVYRDAGGAKHKTKTYQLISPGFDGDYGVGGTYDPDSNSPTASNEDKDNITNFTSGMLDR